ncbi:hypothetical protein SAMN02745116_00275 [Pilibacter termitis]|uniref:Uncharacterized protein n=1 Tax=Pilibacter termitis TaxID=263852 RepID=A0A1T4KIK8_9ENTE|nr:hypothetical protein [Pilibacter termitis]SJZ42205.1 hypothetical protein SAMN02745116_00275 [Pilibacter termitis]
MISKEEVGTPYEVKVSRTVWSGGKLGELFKELPIAISVLAVAVATVVVVTTMNGQHEAAEKEETVTMNSVAGMEAQPLSLEFLKEDYPTPRVEKEEKVVEQPKQEVKEVVQAKPVVVEEVAEPEVTPQVVEEEVVQPEVVYEEPETPQVVEETPQEEPTVPQTYVQPTSPYKLSFNTVPTDSAPESGYGMWRDNFVTAHNPGSGSAFLSLVNGDKVQINGAVYVVVEQRLIWGSHSLYPGAPEQLKYFDVNENVFVGDWIFDGRMTLQTCADNGFSKIWIWKLVQA